ncbi:MAG TPA: acyl-CoA desaturase [Dehalococcoidia bacterium]|nr:acyl-CoA desaturase [Dehalococcoidia bacterium]
MPSALERADGAAAYARLKATIVAEGILERSLGFYAALAAFSLGGFFLSAWAIFALTSYPLLALACLSFSFFSVQLGGLMHDCGHRAVFANVRNNDLLGYVCAALLGMVFDNWKSRHNAHHAHPNQEDLDPDMEIPFIAASEELYAAKGGLQRALIQFQAFYYYPLGAIVSFSNRLGSITYFLRRPLRGNAWRLALWLAGILVLFVSPFLLFPLAKAALVFMLVHVTTGIYLANCFAPNHKAMPCVARDSKMSFLEQQVVTSRNVRGGFLTDLLLVGLNYQIEHHLFPSTPRNKLKLLKPHVEAACRELGIAYTESGFLETNRELVRTLRNVPRAARARAPALAAR